MTDNYKLEALLVVLMGAATVKPSPAAPTFANAVTNGTINISKLVEASGVTASHNNPGVLWTENDSGNAAVVYAIDSQGHDLGTYTLPGNTDNEDIGMGPGPVTNVSYLYVCDIGDNNANRSSIAIYQVPEPAVYAWQTNNPVANRPMKGMRTITLTYPDGAHNAESEFCDPITGDWFVITKESTTAHIFTAPKAVLDVSNTIVLKLVEPLTFDVPSGADISPLGDEIVVRQEEFAHLWARTNGQTVSNAMAGAYTSIPVQGTANGEPNGEAIGFDYYGGGYFTVSDSATTQPLRYFARTSHDGPTPPRVVLPMASSWKYLVTNVDTGTAWQAPGFDDSAWSNGVAQLGYGASNVQTVVSFGTNASSRYLTTYFRKTLSVTNAARIASLTLKTVVDDGALIYLNGALVTQLNLASNAAYNTTATAMPTALRDTWQSYAVDPKLLIEGSNTVAAAVHLASGTATNLSFDLQLIAVEAPVITSLDFSNQAILHLAGSSNAPTTVQGTTDFVSWTSLGSLVLTNGVGSFTDPGSSSLSERFYRASRSVP